MIAPAGDGAENGGGNGGKPKLIPQPHGGALLTGGTPGQKPGPGRPPSIVKAALRQDFDARRSILNDIADGVAVQEVRVPLVAILEHARCPRCEEKLEANDAATLMMVKVDGKISAHPKERLRALDVMGKYSDLESHAIDPSLIEALGNAVMAEVQDVDVLTRIRDRWVDVVAERSDRD